MCLCRGGGYIRAVGVWWWWFRWRVGSGGFGEKLFWWRVGGGVVLGLVAGRKVCGGSGGVVLGLVEDRLASSS